MLKYVKETLLLLAVVVAGGVGAASGQKDAVFASLKSELNTLSNQVSSAIKRMLDSITPEAVAREKERVVKEAEANRKREEQRKQDLERKQKEPEERRRRDAEEDEKRRLSSSNHWASGRSDLHDIASYDFPRSGSSGGSYVP